MLQDQVIALEIRLGRGFGQGITLWVVGAGLGGRRRHSKHTHQLVGAPTSQIENCLVSSADPILCLDACNRNPN